MYQWFCKNRSSKFGEEIEKETFGTQHSICFRLDVVKSKDVSHIGTKRKLRKHGGLCSLEWHAAAYA